MSVYERLGASNLEDYLRGHSLKKIWERVELTPRKVELAKLKSELAAIKVRIESLEGSEA